MTISELITELQKYPQDIMVVVNGYEGGYVEKINIHGGFIKLNVNKQEYYGPHDDADIGEKGLAVAVISRGGNR